MKKRILVCLTVAVSLLSTTAFAYQYTIKQDDTLWKISFRNGIKLDSIILANPQISNPDLIYPNDIINVPVESTTPQQPTQPAPQQPSNNGQVSNQQQEIVKLVNAERSKVGLSPLTGNANLHRVAQTKAEDMTDKNYFSHTSPTYGSPFDMMKKFGISYSAAGENIAKGQKTPQEVMKSWMNSSGHKANILSKNFTQIGVGYDSRSNSWVQMFIRP